MHPDLALFAWEFGWNFKKEMSSGENVRARSVSDGSCQSKSAIQTFLWQALLLWQDPSLTLRALTFSSLSLRNPSRE
jgi:hypothetical protein